MPRKRSSTPHSSPEVPPLTLSLSRFIKSAGSAGIAQLDSDSPANLPFWIAWARATLSERGLLPPPGQPASVADLIHTGLKGLAGAAEAWGANLLQLEECGRSHPQKSPESLAARLLLAGMIRSGGILAHNGDESQWAERSAAIVGEIRVCLQHEQLAPDAKVGEALKHRNRHASRRGVQVRRENAAEDRKRLAQAVKRYRLSNPDASERQMAADLALTANVETDAMRARIRRL